MAMVNERTRDYGTIIEIKDDVTYDVLSYLQNVIRDAFCNRAGTVRNTSKETRSLRSFEFSGEEDKFVCLQLGLFKLYEDKQFVNSVKTWKWFEEDPSQWCDVLEELSKPLG